MSVVDTARTVSKIVTVLGILFVVSFYAAWEYGAYIS